jgi:hypothetical protein
MALLLGLVSQLTPPPSGSLSGVVRDSTNGTPLSGALVRVERGDTVIRVQATAQDGHYRITGLDDGPYTVSAIHIGYRPSSRSVVIVGDADLALDFTLGRSARLLDTLTVTGHTPVAVDVATGNQSFEQQNYHGAPSTTTSQIIQQAIAGAARAPTGEVHIRGQHGEYTYYIDGVPVPAGISGSLNELFDPAVVGRIDFQTGGWDAEYGNKNIAIINVTTRIPPGGLRADAAVYGGSYGSAGETIVASTNAGQLSLLLSGTHQTTDMRREPVMQNSLTGAPLNFHNHGSDDFGFAKVQYAPSSHDRITLDANLSQTQFQVPFDSAAGIQDDHQQDLNGFVNLGWRHQFDTAAVGHWRPQSLFAAIYLRHGGLDYTPGPDDRPQFIFYPDTIDRYTVRENRTATTVGVKADLAVSLTRGTTFKTGFDGSIVTGREDFDTRDSLDVAGPVAHAAVHGGDIGVYAETVTRLSARWEFRTGLRLDHHIAPLAGDQHQLSPRIRVAYNPTPLTSFWAYYGRLFIPSNVEDFHVLASAAQGDTVGLPTVPERDNYFESGVVHRFGTAVSAKFVGYHRQNGPAVDDNTLPGTALTTTVNIAQVNVAGLEAVIDVQPAGALSGYANIALSHASAHGPITGGFFPTAYPVGWFDQDHDQRLSIVASGQYAPGWGFLSLSAIFGSGLTNGHPEAVPNGTGLFDFNSAVKVAPSFILNASAGTHWRFGATTLRPELFVDNVFDHHYVLKGAFTSGPSIGRPRSVQIRVNASWGEPSTAHSGGT